MGSVRSFEFHSPHEHEGRQDVPDFDRHHQIDKYGEREGNHQDSNARAGDFRASLKKRETSPMFQASEVRAGPQTRRLRFKKRDHGA